jgi:hypothetical protein
MVRANLRRLPIGGELNCDPADLSGKLVIRRLGDEY